jgi:hypothetical protein
MTRLPTLALLVLAGCKLQMSGIPHFGSSSSSSSSSAAAPSQASAPATAPSSAGSTAGAATRRPPAAVEVDAGPPARDEKYDACVAQFDKQYDAWLPVDRETKAVLAAVKDKSPYVAVPALLKAYEHVDDKAAVRQTGARPIGAVYASATRMELTLTLAELGNRTHADTCISSQLWLGEPASYQAPLTGDRARDKIALCGGPTAAERAASATAKKTAVERLRSLRDQAQATPRGGRNARVASYAASPKETTLAMANLYANYRCVKNGRYGRLADGSWGQLCDIEDLPANTDAKAEHYHLAPQALPFAIKRGDDVNLAFELDPEAPASRESVPKTGGWWWLSSLSRGDKPVFEMCSTPKAHQAQIHTPLDELLLAYRR